MNADITAVNIGVTKQLFIFCLLVLHLLQIGSHIVGKWKDSVATVGFCAVRVHYLAFIHNSGVADMDRASVKINGFPSEAADLRAAQAVSYGELHRNFQRFPTK